MNTTATEYEVPGVRSDDRRPIGVFDSGIGGLSVVRHLQQQLPQEDLLYFADQDHIPYGVRPAEQIIDFTSEISRFLIAHGAKAIVVACNTATTIAIDALRAGFPEIPYIGMEPALKPAAAVTQSGRIGVLATLGTFASPRYAMLMDRFARQVEVYENPCIGLVGQIEAGNLQLAETKRILVAATGPMLDAGVDTLVLGCTHYPFVLPLLRTIVGDDITIIDPAPAVARQTKHVLQQRGWLDIQSTSGGLYSYTSGDPLRYQQLANQLLDQRCPVRHVDWMSGELISDTVTTVQ